MSKCREVMWFGLSLFFIGMPLTQAASPAAVEFSADTYQTDPQNNQRTGHIYVGSSRIRSDTQQNGQPIVNIIDTENQITWVLYPQQRSYIEYRMDATQGGAVEKGSPCEGIPGAQCKNLGDDAVQGREATKWEVIMPAQGRSVQSTQWIGKQRSILLRQEVQGGPVMAQRMLGVEQLNGRQVEKWEMTVDQDSQPQQRSTRWFDPQLNLAIKEESPGGYIRELRNISIGTQDPGLFRIPEQFKKIVPQQQSKTQ